LVARLTKEARQWPTLLSSSPQAADASVSLRLKAAFGGAARSLKHQLSETTQAEEFVLPNLPPARLSRAELVLLASPLLDRTVLCCHDLLEQLKVPVAEITAIVMVGGSTRIPAVAETLQRAFGLNPLRADDPDMAVVRGAAHWVMSNAVRSLPPLPCSPNSTLLRWTVPSARLLRWMIPIGAEYQKGTPLARVRYVDGTIWDLCASRPGRLEQVFANPGDQLSSVGWLAIAHEEQPGQ
jgi:molecular chaperone DnaK